MVGLSSENFRYFWQLTLNVLLMKKFCFLSVFILFARALASQPCPETYSQEVLESNRLSVNILNNGNLFNRNGEGFFKIPYTGLGSPTTIRKAGLWIGGVDPGGNLKMAASAVDSDNEQSDFAPGPLDPATGYPYEGFPCGHFDQVWKVTREEILTHVKDFRDDWKIDNPIPAILYWPGQGNPHFKTWPGGEPGLPERDWGWAPFWDEDGNGIYDPLKGDYPILDVIGPDEYLPEAIFWTVFHDVTEHPLTKGAPLHVEVQLTAWTRSCPYNEFAQNSLFTRYRIFNRAKEDLDSIVTGIWVDFELGCGEDDYLGSLPGSDAFFVYNKDNFDGDESGSCNDGVISYGKNPPAMAVSFPVYHPALHYFMYYPSEGSFDPGGGPLENDSQFYNYLTGRWKDGTPLTRGGHGYNPGSTNYTRFAFPGNPNDTSQWTMLKEQLPSVKRYAIGSVPGNYYSGDVNVLQAGAGFDLYVIFSYHQYPGVNHLELLNRMEKNDLHLIPNAVSGFSGWSLPICEDGSDYSEPEEQVQIPIGIYPNPANDFLTIYFPGTDITDIALLNTSGQVVFYKPAKNKDKHQLDLQSFIPGLYFLRLRVNGHYLTEKIVIGPK